MARIVFLVNFILFSLSWAAAIASSDVDVSSSNAESSNISNSSSSDAGSPSSSGSESYLASSATSSSNSLHSTLFSSKKRVPSICPEGKKKLCPDNEEFSNCTQAVCRQTTCKDKKLPLSCPAIKEGDCNSGCVCQSGYLRTPKGKCVPQYQCSGDLVCETNEVVNNCPNSGHGDCCPKSEKDAKSRKKLKVITECEEHSCTCRFNYMRADNGTCIPARDCPPFNCSGENEKFVPCPPLCPTDDCAQATPSGRCPLPGRIGIVLQCRADCRCKTGFWRKNGVCVPYSECPGICPQNEEYSECMQGVCRAQNCTQKGKPIVCAGIAEGSCEKGCICSSGFLRDEHGNCIPDDQCRAGMCPANEEISYCTQALCRPENCTQKGKPIACPRIAEGFCEIGCVCSIGFLRDEYGNCIPDDQCPIPKCDGQYEVLAECPNGCAPINCPESLKAEQERLADCVSIAVCLPPDCRCRPDYRRNAEGRCIHIGECPGICPANEEFSNCTQAVCRAQNCVQKGKPIVCPGIAENSCEKGCVCSTGFLRNAEGNCVPENQCTACRSNENFSNCIQATCRTLNCSQRGFPLDCLSVAKGKCQSGCVCQAGFLKTAKGDCVPDSQCYGDLVCDDNEVAVASRNDAINDYCPRFEGDKGEISENTSETEGPVCVCRFNHKRSYDNGTCIPTVDCPPFECNRPYEEYRSCPPWCPSDNCSQATPTGRCQIFGRVGIVLECNPKCRCIQGYWRDNGTCVPYAACPGKCPTNERYSSCIQGECRALNCTQKGKPIACPRLVPGACKNGCVCIEGTLRAENGSCIPEKECPALKCNGQNEVLAECANGCDPINCPESLKAEQERLAGCNAIAVCLPPDCRCRPDYRRDEEERCIYIGECPGICPNNEEFSNCTQALCRIQNCTQKGKPVACAGIAEGSCEKGCVCLNGFLRDEYGNCVPDNQCTAPKCDGQNEVLAECPNGCDPINCPKSFQAEQERLADCVSIAVCLPPDCRCRPDYRRDEKGRCIPIGECPSICPNNEEFSNCTQALCRAQNCTQKGKPIACAGIAECFCEKGCVCLNGFLREYGNCIPDDQCKAPKCDGQNEVLAECSNGCDPINCPKSFQAEQKRLADCVSIAVCLPPDCRCRPDYRRDEEGRCIPIGECPGICPNNEEFSNCTQALCRAQNCTQKGKPIAYVGIAEDSCEKGCVCLNGFLRDEYGNCIPDEQCTAPKCDGQNEVLAECPNGCDPINCPKSFQAEQERLADCVSIAVCLPPDCRCRPNYRRDEEGKCIPIGECPGICPNNEEFSNCTQALCRAQNCTQKGKPIACAGIAEDSCEKGCVCLNGFLRDEYGNCIPDDQCTAPKCDGQNEVLAECPNGCDPINCPKSFQVEQERLADCVSIAVCLPPDCRCRPDYRRDEERRCIPIGECPGICHNNEEFSNCTQALCRAQNCTQKGKPIVCPEIAEGSCEKGCVCSSGFLRDGHGNCIHDDQCPAASDDCPPNEEYSTCTQAVCRPLDCTQRGMLLPCPAIAEGYCHTGCICVDGYLRDEEGHCVAESKCAS